MVSGSPRMWTLTVGSSPGPLPKVAWWLGRLEIHDLVTEAPMPEVAAVGDDLAPELLSWLGAHTLGSDGATVDEALAAAGGPPLAERHPVLLLGELGNPNRLGDLFLDALPIWPVRLDGLARVWNDRMDARDVQPGVHHVTLATSAGWFESTQLGFASPQQLTQLLRWLCDRSAGSWLPVRLTAGSVSLHQGRPLTPPSYEDLIWDGQLEGVRSGLEVPAPNGPTLPLTPIIALVHARYGVYDHRGRLARCAHFDQRTFHDELYRRGSAKRWDAVLAAEPLPIR